MFTSILAVPGASLLLTTHSPGLLWPSPVYTVSVHVCAHAYRLCCVVYTCEPLAGWLRMKGWGGGFFPGPGGGVLPPCPVDYRDPGLPLTVSKGRVHYSVLTGEESVTTGDWDDNRKVKMDKIMTPISVWNIIILFVASLRKIYFNRCLRHEKNNTVL